MRVFDEKARSIISTETTLSEIYFQDLIGNIAFKFTSRFRNTKVLTQHPCIKIYVNNKQWESNKYESYIDYMTKTSEDYYIDTLYLSKYCADKWLKKNI